MTNNTLTRMLKPYLRTMQLSWQKGLEYRFGILYLLLEAILPITAMVLLWKTIYESNGTMAGYTFNQMVTYFIAGRLINYLVLYPMDWKMHEMVNQGTLSSLLARPVDVQSYYFADMVGNRIVNFVLGCTPLGIIAILLRNYISLNPNYVELILGIVAIMLACGMWFLLSWAVGCYVFWTHNLISILFMKELIVMVLAGGFFPIDILPSPMVHIIKLTPFPYLTFFPIHVLTNTVNSDEVMNGLMMQAIWLTILFILGRILWQIGMKKYVEAGG
ncbi:ABC-2 family transporter protein [Paenibacillus sediminis]|uniref:ABC-2 type transport system permease protein n=1 Tax=Paenibacillus sediminis TaxID=664909 RepID=A0ABS4H7Z5_9BACL|nr:ABC-2 family transporter protein [Paenibacillus sediminis]MBP1938657.1 ABC-2 type transport system permease protein [Paenibacillus sediminis]